MFTQRNTHNHSLLPVLKIFFTNIIPRSLSEAMMKPTRLLNIFGQVVSIHRSASSKKIDQLRRCKETSSVVVYTNVKKPSAMARPTLPSFLPRCPRSTLIYPSLHRAHLSPLKESWLPHGFTVGSSSRSTMDL